MWGDTMDGYGMRMTAMTVPLLHPHTTRKSGRTGWSFLSTIVKNPSFCRQIHPSLEVRNGGNWTLDTHASMISKAKHRLLWDMNATNIAMERCHNNNNILLHYFYLSSLWGKHIMSSASGGMGIGRSTNSGYRRRPTAQLKRTRTNHTNHILFPSHPPNIQ